VTARPRAPWAFAQGFVLAGCTLLHPYPGDGDPREALVDHQGSGLPDPEQPLLDPPTDPDVSVLNNLEDVVVALPGGTIPVSLDFQAPARNVLGGGIRFEGTQEIQWTILERVRGEQSGDVEFGYVVAKDACEDLANLCHEIAAEEFVVTDRGGEIHVSAPLPVTIVLQCATCDSQSCLESLPAGACQQCVQPEACKELYLACYGPGAPNEGTSDADVFEQFLGEDGSLWKSEQTCFEGAGLCEAFLEDMRCAF
jgi:hypothetical protein